MCIFYYILFFLPVLLQRVGETDMPLLHIIYMLQLKMCFPPIAHMVSFLPLLFLLFSLFHHFSLPSIPSPMSLIRFSCPPSWKQSSCTIKILSVLSLSFFHSVWQSYMHTLTHTHTHREGYRDFIIGCGVYKEHMARDLLLCTDTWTRTAPAGQRVLFVHLLKHQWQTLLISESVFASKESHFQKSST